MMIPYLLWPPFMPSSLFPFISSPLWPVFCALPFVAVQCVISLHVRVMRC
jgi:hypothetical protein